MMPGGFPIGSYVELSPPAEEMGVAEGIETALAVTRDFGIPCWSTISADGLKAFTPPAIVKRLRIFGDNDPKYGGQAAAYALVHRMSVSLACVRSEEPKFELQSLILNSTAVLFLPQKNIANQHNIH